VGISYGYGLLVRVRLGTLRICVPNNRMALAFGACWSPGRMHQHVSVGLFWTSSQAQTSMETGVFEKHTIDQHARQSHSKRRPASVKTVFSLAQHRSSAVKGTFSMLGH
jgi:hypothetical protein